MSDQSIAAIARSLAAELLIVFEQHDGDDQQQEQIAALETELCAEYRAEITEAVKVIA